MARQESDREDLFSEAVALSQRAEFNLPPAANSSPAMLLIGQRDNGWLSLYIGADPVYHFDERNRLRRAYQEGLLFRSQGQTLSRMWRDRTATETILRRHDLSDVELAGFRAKLTADLSRLLTAWKLGELRVNRQSPADNLELPHHLWARLAECVPEHDWLAPAVPGRR